MRLSRPGSARVPAILAALALALPLSAGAATAQPMAERRLATSRVTTVSADDISFIGHGWGHGRGMGQYGALGYAVDHGWSHLQILDHFYGGTARGNVGNPEMSVELLAMTNLPLVVVGRQVLVNGVDLGTAARLTLQPGGSLLVERGTGCASTWTAVAGTFIGNATRVTTSIAPATLDDLLRVCEATGGRAYRGELSVVNHQGVQMAINHLPTESYLQGVVPRESPASWGSLGSGRGMEALKAQAIAARSYALSSSRATGARTCDTTACQVYKGAAFKYPSGVWENLEAANTNLAVAQTAGEVRVWPSNNSVVRTEFSSSTGGYTVAGAFPAVVDEGDDISNNPNHNWTATFTTAQVAAKLDISGVRSITVTGRNGLGDLGGRVTQVVVVDGAGGSHTYSGGQFRTAMGTDTFKSDWFAVAWISPAVAEAVVKALYQDLLGRAPDPTGLTGWSSLLMRGTSQSALVSSLTSSGEYIGLRVRQAYVEVLGREPDPAGAAGWAAAIVERRATVDDVQRIFYDSQEYFLVSGGTSQGYVARLYTTMLGREASAGEVATWVGLMGSRGRTWVVDAIWFSMEAARHRAGAYYHTFLGREPDPVGLEGWGRVLLSQGEGAVRAGIAGSQEYRNRAIARYP